MLLKFSKFLLYLVPFSLVIVYQGTLFPFIVGKYIFFRIIVDLALVFFALHWVMENKIVNVKKKEDKLLKLPFVPLAVTVGIFSLIYILAGFFGVNSQASFWSNFERGEGSLQIIHLLIFFALLGTVFNNKESWRKLFIVNIWVSVCVILYGILGTLGVGNFIGSNLCLRFAGSLGNPAYTGTFLIFAIFYSLYLFNEDFKIKIKWLWIGLAVLFFIFLLLTQTRGALLGLGVAIIFGLLYLFFNLLKGKLRNIVLMVIIFLILLGGLAIKFRRSIDIMPFCSAQSGGNRILDVNFQTETFQTRLLLWQESINAFKERPILGWGPENFTVAFEKYYQPQFTTWYDRAHNIFFDYLVMTGLFGLLSFISIFGVYYWQFFTKMQANAENSLTGGAEQRGKDKSLLAINYKSLVGNALLFALPIAYLVQGLVLFDVLPIYINLFLFLAFANWKFVNK